ncbi:MAG: sigma-54 dependent transcriptional regulator [Pyrinomonadaceae bacterium]
MGKEINLHQSMIGESAPMRQVLQFISKVATVESSVLILGESGTGKELVARAIHQNSHRTDQPFVAINCATLTHALLETELFGHERGAFTGAITQKKGQLEVADGGTVFLDEIGELAAELQAKLLRVLQQHEFTRVGGTRLIKINIRVIAATNRNLEKALHESKFRQDLYFRLNVVSVRAPPLRERREDIQLLANYFVAKHGKACNRRVRGLSSAALRHLKSYDWPGNVRELENAIERVVVLGEAEYIMTEDLPETIVEAGGAVGAETSVNYFEAVKQTKKQLILSALDNAQGNITEAAKVLGMYPTYLHRLMRNLI